VNIELNTKKAENRRKIPVNISAYFFPPSSLVIRQAKNIDNPQDREEAK
jgi:hypothetical protein